MEAIAAKGRVAIIADPIVESQFRDVSERLHDAGCEVIQYPFGGECTRAEIDRLAGLARDLEPHVVIGAGGGKALDTAKGVVMELGCSLVIVPTIASSDAPTSRLIAIYDEHHNIAETPSLKRNPHAVVVDTTILAAAPRRFLAAGIGDALTKKFEVASTIKSNRLNYFGGRPRASPAFLPTSVTRLSAPMPLTRWQPRELERRTPPLSASSRHAFFIPAFPSKAVACR